MRKPDGFEATSKGRHSVATPAASGSSSPMRPPSDSVVRKRRQTTSQQARSTTHASSSPFGDDDEPSATVGRTFASRRTVVDNLEDDEGDEYGATESDPLGEGHGGLMNDFSTTSSQKPISKGKKRSLSHENGSAALLESSTAGAGRKRKLPSYSASSSPPILPLSDDDNERESDDGDEYAGSKDKYALPRGVSGRRSSSVSARRTLPSSSRPSS